MYTYQVVVLERVSISVSVLIIALDKRQLLDSKDVYWRNVGRLFSFHVLTT